MGDMGAAEAVAAVHQAQAANIWWMRLCINLDFGKNLLILGLLMAAGLGLFKSVEAAREIGRRKRI